MKTTKKPLHYVLVAILFVIVACQSPDKKESLYPENEIPVNTTSVEALQHFVTGLDIFDQGNRIKARSHFDKALELDPNFISAQMYRAYCSTSNKEWSGNRDKLLAMYDQANEGEKIQMDLIKIGMEGDEDKEFAISERLVEKYPNSARAYDNLADAYSNLDNMDEARKQWTKAMALNPDYLPAIRNLGLSYLFTTPKDFKKAEEYMLLAVEKAPKSSRVQIDLGDTYRAQNDLPKALASYNKAAELDPEDQVALSKAGHANSYLGNYEDARKNFQDSRAISELGLGSYNFEGYTHLYEGDPKKALAFLHDVAKKVDTMDIPESNKTGAKMNCVYDCAMIAMHHGDTDHLKEVVEMMKPLSVQISKDVGSKSATLYQKANMHYWDAMASASEGKYDDAIAKAELIKTTLASINEPNKLRAYHRAHTIINYHQENYDTALEHAAHLDKDDVYDVYWMARINKKAGNTDKAMELFNEIADYNFNQVEYALIRKEVKEIVASAN